MKLAYGKRFLRDLAKLPSPARDRIEHLVFEELPDLDLSEPSTIRLKPLKGFQGFYRLRLGSYRIGIERKGTRWILRRVLHRKDIYRYFP